MRGQYFLEPQQKVNKLTFIKETRRVYNGWNKLRYGLFECECGTQCEMIVYNVAKGMSTSCGCIGRGVKKRI